MQLCTQWKQGNQCKQHKQWKQWKQFKQCKQCQPLQLPQVYYNQGLSSQCRCVSSVRAGALTCTSAYLFDTLVTDMVYGGMVSPVSVTVVQTSTSDGTFTPIHNGGWAFSLPLFLHQEHKCLGHERTSWWQHLCKDQQLASHPGLPGPTKDQL